MADMARTSSTRPPDKRIRRSPACNRLRRRCSRRNRNSGATNGLLPHCRSEKRNSSRADSINTQMPVA